MKNFVHFTCRAGSVAAVFCVLLNVMSHGVPQAQALAYGAGDSPTPSPTPTGDGSKTYDFPEGQPLVTITTPPKWGAVYERDTGRLLCLPDDRRLGYTAVFSQAGDFDTPAQAETYLVAQVKETIAAAKLTTIKLHPIQSGKLGSGLPCQVQVIDGKIGNLPTRFVFISVAPVEGRYFLLVASGRQDRLATADFGAIGPMAASIKAR